MADVYDLNWYRENGTLKSPSEIEEVLETMLPRADELSTVMMMSTDELFVDLLTRVENGKSIRDDTVSMETLIAELTNRVVHMELLCQIAQSKGEI